MLNAPHTLFWIEYLKSEISLFRLIGPGWTWGVSQPFKARKNNSIYVKLFKNNMDGKNSFMSTDVGLETLVAGDKKALISAHLLQTYEAYHCKESKPSNIV